MKILVTGGAGYIGSHTCCLLLEQGHDVYIFDNLSNSNIKAIEGIEKISNKKVEFFNNDLLKKNEIDSFFDENQVDGVIHFAGLKAVGESVENPLLYYNNNITGTINLCLSMEEHNIRNIIFSSSATVYGDPIEVPISEECPKGCITSPYGQTKSMIEQILYDIHKSNTKWNVILLRYFNPIGAHKSGLIGEDPKGIPNNLVPYIAKVAVGQLKEVGVFGNDYDTKDGTGVRDYIHVMDLALGHVLALNKFNDEKKVRIYNLGTGKGYSVLEVIEAYEKATGKNIAYKILPRRAGDIGTCYADVRKAKKELFFEAKLDILEMCKDSWNWQSNNPGGYNTK